MKGNGRIVAAVCVGSLAALASGSYGAYQENFNLLTAGNPITTVAGWSYYSGSTTAVLTSSGYNNSVGLSIPGYSKYDRLLSSGESMTYADGPLTFRTKLSFTANDQWTSSTISLAKTGGISALNVTFSGGSASGSADNVIRVSNGGADWGNTSYTEVLDANNNSIRWTSGVWYEIVVHDVLLLNTGNGTNVTGKIDIYGDGNLIVSNVAISGMGKDNYRFDQIDHVFLSGYRVIYDDLSLTAVPEPAALGVLSIGLAAAVLKRKRG